MRHLLYRLLGLAITIASIGLLVWIDLNMDIIPGYNPSVTVNAIAYMVVSAILYQITAGIANKKGEAAQEKKDKEDWEKLKMELNTTLR